MSDLRDELEKGFSSVETQSETQPDNSNAIEEQPISQETAVIDEWMDAPKAYTKEYQETFKTLSPEWRKYLIEREKQVEKGFSEQGNKISSYKWIDDAYNARQERLNKLGFSKMQEYAEHLLNIDDAFDKDPASTLRVLADAYGVDLNNGNNALSSLQSQISNLQQMMSSQQAYIQNQQKVAANNAFDVFINAKDEGGNLKHPHWEAVRQDMSTLLSKGLSTTLEDAYERAVWSNKDVREKMIAAQKQAEISSKVAEAGKAKEAGFTPKSKNTAPKDDLTLRQVLEAAFEEF
jgi:hypothetical protein